MTGSLGKDVNTVKTVKKAQVFSGKKLPPNASGKELPCGKTLAIFT
jgi:hypothetical protein